MNGIFAELLQPASFAAHGMRRPRSSQLACSTVGMLLIGALLAPAQENPGVVRGAMAPEGPAARMAHPLDPALGLMRKCAYQYRSVRDYTATLVRQESVGKQLEEPVTLTCKVRTEPHSVYLRWLQPARGKEAIYVQGQHDDKVLSHVAGIAKALTGTVAIDPDSPLARQFGQRSLRDFGIGHLIRTLQIRWEFERNYQLTQVTVENATLNQRPCWLITTSHPQPDQGLFMYHTLRVFVDKEHLLPIRLEEYAYPSEPGPKPGPLVRVETFLELSLNAGLSESDFSTSNPAYNFSRF